MRNQEQERRWGLGRVVVSAFLFVRAGITVIVGVTCLWDVPEEGSVPAAKFSYLHDSLQIHAIMVTQAWFSRARSRHRESYTRGFISKGREIVLTDQHPPSSSSKPPLIIFWPQQPWSNLGQNGFASDRIQLYVIKNFSKFSPGETFWLNQRNQDQLSWAHPPGLIDSDSKFG
ncbi:hypothetical protein QBC42DRAFT_345189 [Cladorrhinum samala]|uniref:Uncharacterized protein n=1 Tax=Cladorrhinum samala TaxID=585594 RepID=A0AAV9HVT9_9PEZI|nr:hypothetical protein QBC42DRAFT_345189 [Cladorrhinum samala]